MDDCSTVLMPEYWHSLACARSNSKEFPFDGFLYTLQTGKLPAKEAHVLRPGVLEADNGI